MKTTNKYEVEKRVVKGVFWAMVCLWSIITTEFIIQFNWYSILGILDLDLIQDIWGFSFFFLVLLPIFLVKNYSSWRTIPIITFIFASSNMLLRDRAHDLDYLLIGPRPITILIYIISIVISIVFIIREIQIMKSK